MVSDVSALHCLATEGSVLNTWYTIYVLLSVGVNEIDAPRGCKMEIK